MLKEMDLIKPVTKNFISHSIYLGGGTPSLLTTSQLKTIYDAVFYNFAISENPEVTLEVNPATMTSDTLEKLDKLPVNRISLGIQSFNDEMLSYLGRPHTVSDSYKAYESFRNLSVESINCDLIFAIPGQSMDDWCKNIESIIELYPQHISLYAFSFDRDSYFTKLYEQGKIHPIDETIERQMYEYAIDTLTGHGYIHYEISNFALQGYESHHNRLYWKNKPYIGLGAGAYSYIDGERYCSVKDITRYLNLLENNQRPYIEHERLTPEQSLRETAALNIRIIDEGIFYPELSKQYPDLNPDDLLHDTLMKLTDDGLMVQIEKQRFVLTRKGILFADTVSSSIV